MAKLQNLARFKKVSESETVSTTTDYHEALFSNTDNRIDKHSTTVIAKRLSVTNRVAYL